jgi:hypothetical protein
MRYFFPNLTRPKMSAKILADIHHLSLSRAQRVVARTLGYSDWHDLERNHKENETFALDEFLTSEEQEHRHLALALKLSSELPISDGDAQYAISRWRLTGNRSLTLQQQINVRLGCFRNTVLPAPQPRQPGAVGRVVAGGWKELVILRRFGAPTEVVMHNGIGTVADFEYRSLKHAQSLFLPMRLYLPYGHWVESDGARVLFSRDYKPLWRLRNGKAPERIEPWVWIKFQEQTWFWDDSNPPWKDEATKLKMEKLLTHLGAVTLPILADGLPLLIHDLSLKKFSSVPEALQLARSNTASAA